MRRDIPKMNVIVTTKGSIMGGENTIIDQNIKGPVIYTSAKSLVGNSLSQFFKSLNQPIDILSAVDRVLNKVNFEDFPKNGGKLIFKNIVFYEVSTVLNSIPNVTSNWVNSYLDNFKVSCENDLEQAYIIMECGNNR